MMIIRLVRILLLAALGYFLYKILWKGEFPKIFKGGKQKKHPQQPLEEMKKDPVCGTYVPESNAVKLRQNGRVICFCSEECKEKYKNLPK